MSDEMFKLEREVAILRNENELLRKQLDLQVSETKRLMMELSMPKKRPPKDKIPKSFVSWCVLVLLCCCVVASAQRKDDTNRKDGDRTVYRDSNGKAAGTATTSGDRTVYRDASGRVSGTSTSSGGSTQYRDAHGKATDTASTTSKTREGKGK